MGPRGLASKAVRRGASPCLSMPLHLSSVRALPALSLLTLTLPAWGQGSLAPPPGEPAPTMKTLEQIGARIAELEARNAALEAQAAAFSHVLAQGAGGQASQRLFLGLLQPPGSLPWQLATVAEEADIGPADLAFGPDGQPAVAVRQRLAPGSTQFHLLHARFDGRFWRQEIVDPTPGTGGRPSLAFGPDGRPAIAYRSASGGGLRLARFDGAAWTIESLPSAGTDAADPTLAFDAAGQAALAYRTGTGNSALLRLVEEGPNGWLPPVTIDSAPGSGHDAALVFGPNGRPAVVHTRLPAREARLSTFDGTSWTTVSVAAASAADGPPSLAFGTSGEPLVAYAHDRGGALGGELRLARRVGAGWTVSTVDAAARTGQMPSLALDPGGQPVIAYFDAANGDLRLARAEGGNWILLAVETAGETGRHPALAYGPDGQPAVAYVDLSRKALRVARHGVFSPAP
jgi:hypothetical protein